MFEVLPPNTYRRATDCLEGLWHAIDHEVDKSVSKAMKKNTVLRPRKHNLRERFMGQENLEEDEQLTTRRRCAECSKVAAVAYGSDCIRILEESHHHDLKC